MILHKIYNKMETVILIKKYVLNQDIHLFKKTHLSKEIYIVSNFLNAFNKRNNN